MTQTQTRTTVRVSTKSMMYAGTIVHIDNHNLVLETKREWIGGAAHREFIPLHRIVRVAPTKEQQS